MIVLSDCHISETPVFGIDTSLNLKTILNTLAHETRHILFLGDNVNRGTEPEYERLFALIKRYLSKRDVYILNGNHDNYELLSNYCQHYNCHLVTNNTFVIENRHLAFLNSCLPGQDYGYVNDKTLDFLDMHLAGVKNKNIIVLHHHLQPVGGMIDNYITQNRHQVIDILRKHQDKIEYVLSGHTHRHFDQIIDDIRYISAPSTAFGFGDDDSLKVIKSSQAFRLP
ncbi:MAG: metallophosphoesterase family protein [Francisellaceae bacterium]